MRMIPVSTDLGCKDESRGPVNVLGDSWLRRRRSWHLLAASALRSQIEGTSRDVDAVSRREAVSKVLTLGSKRTLSHILYH